MYQPRSSYLKPQSINVWAADKATREFLCVEDCAEAILFVAKRYNKSDPINIGAGFEISIKGLVEIITKLVRSEGDIIWDVSQLDGQPRRIFDTSRAERELA